MRWFEEFAKIAPATAAFAAPCVRWSSRIVRRLFFLALLMGAATFNLFYSFMAGLLMFVGLYVFALWTTKRDPQMLRILLSSSRFRPRYDPAKHVPVHITVRPC